MWKNRKTKVHEADCEYPPLPEGPWPVIYADPPWRYQNWTDKAHGAAKAWYSTLSLEDLIRLPVRDVAAADSFLFLWVTGPKLPEGLSVMEAWGYEYVGLAFDWLKTYRQPFEIDLSDLGDFRQFVSDWVDVGCGVSDHRNPAVFMEQPSRVKKVTVLPGNPYCGLGFRTRQANELCLLGKRGKGRPKKSSSVLASVIAPRTRHSEKPIEVYDRIEELVDGPYLELFARQTHEGWESWGNDVK